MSWTDEETNRVIEIERTVNQLQTAISNLASQKQLKALLVLKQADIDALTAQVASLQSQLALLQVKL
jgi:hypothetical protein